MLSEFFDPFFRISGDSNMILNKGSILGIGYLAIMCTAVALLFQTIGQSYTPSSTAAIILGLESIFSIIFAVILAGENYLTPIQSHLKHLELPLKGMKIGERLQFLTNKTA